MFNNGIKGAFRREGAGVKLVDYIVLKRQSKPVTVFPWKIRVYYL